jgi:hypothetical protein
MAFSSFDHLISRSSRGFKKRIEFANQFVGTGTLGRWYDLSPFNRVGPQNLWSGTSLTWTSCNESAGNGTQNFALQHGGNVSAATKHIINTAGVTTVATGLGVLQLIDMQGYWPNISTNSTSAQNLSGTPTLRYNNGEGCQMYFTANVASGATAHNIAVSYTNSAGTPGQALRLTTAMTPSAIAGHISHSGTAANNAGPWLPLAAGDTGVANVASVTFSGASGAGNGALVIAKPLVTIPLTAALTMTERDLIAAVPSLPRIRDGACLSWLYYSYGATAAATTWYGHIDVAWA